MGGCHHNICDVRGNPQPHFRAKGVHKRMGLCLELYGSVKVEIFSSALFSVTLVKA